MLDEVVMDGVVVVAGVLGDALLEEIMLATLVVELDVVEVLLTVADKLVLLAARGSQCRSIKVIPQFYLMV